MLQEVAKHVPESTNIEPLENAVRVAVSDLATKGAAMDQVRLLYNLASQADGISCNFPSIVAEATRNLIQIKERAGGKATPESGSEQRRAFSTAARDTSAMEVSEMLQEVAKHLPESTDLESLEDAVRVAVSDPATKGAAMDQVRLLYKLASHTDGISENFPWSVAAVTRNLIQIKEQANGGAWPSVGSIQKRTFSTAVFHREAWTKLRELRTFLSGFQGTKAANELEALAEETLENPITQQLAMREIDKLLELGAKDRKSLMRLTRHEWLQVLDGTSIALRILLRNPEPWLTKNKSAAVGARRHFSTSLSDGDGDLDVIDRVRKMAEARFGKTLVSPSVYDDLSDAYIKARKVDPVDADGIVEHAAQMVRSDVAAAYVGETPTLASQAQWAESALQIATLRLQLVVEGQRQDDDDDDDDDPSYDYGLQPPHLPENERPK